MSSRNEAEALLGSPGVGPSALLKEQGGLEGVNWLEFFISRKPGPDFKVRIGPRSWLDSLAKGGRLQ